jgi:alkylation response protein AidB-like acyl-CoA dehydrogenase
MNFALSAEQLQFAASLHDLLAAAGVPAVSRSWVGGDRKPGLAVWRSLAEAGVTALLVGPEHGGLGAGPVDLVVACEEIGHHAVPGPAAESLAAVPWLLAGCGGEAWLAALANGELIATLAAPPWLPFAADTDVTGLTLLAGTDSLAMGVTGRTHRSVDGVRTLAEVTAGAPIASGPQVAAALATALDLGALACAAQLLGAGRALLELTAGHARQRIQFGQPVGSFQAVKHHLADVAIGLEFARPLLFGAAVSLGAGSADAPRDVSAAKVACADAADLAARIALQVHGAIGYTAEHDVGRYLTRIRALAPAWGSQSEHRARVLAALRGASGGRPPGTASRGVSGGRPPGAASRGVSGGRPPGAAQSPGIC